MSQVAEFEKCRALLHAWEPMAPPLHHGRQGDRTLFLSCVRCGSEKTTDLEPNGAISYTKITHSPGYRRFLDDHHLDSRADHRLALEARVAKARRRLKSIS